MKAHKLLFITALALISFQKMSPTEILSYNNTCAGRTPAAEVKDNLAESVVCKSELKGEKLEADIKQLLVDKESIIKEVKAEAKPTEKKLDEKVSHKSENSEIIALMVQMTTMFSNQMQSQMQMQVQMMGMLSQMQNNMMPEISPYAYNPSQFRTRQNFAGYPYGVNGGFTTFSEGLQNASLGLGIQAQSPWSQYNNPYTVMPSLNRQQLYTPTDLGFSMNPFNGYDFSQPSIKTQSTPILEKQQMVFSAPPVSA